MGVDAVNGAIGVHWQDDGTKVWGFGASTKASDTGAMFHGWHTCGETRTVALIAAATDRPSFEAELTVAEEAAYDALTSKGKSAVAETAVGKRALGTPYR